MTKLSFAAVAEAPASQAGWSIGKPVWGGVTRIHFVAGSFAGALNHHPGLAFIVTVGGVSRVGKWLICQAPSAASRPPSGTCGGRTVVAGHVSEKIVSFPPAPGFPGRRGSWPAARSRWRIDDRTRAGKFIGVSSDLSSRDSHRTLSGRLQSLWRVRKRVRAA